MYQYLGFQSHSAKSTVHLAKRLHTQLVLAARDTVSMGIQYSAVIYVKNSNLRTAKIAT